MSSYWNLQAHPFITTLIARTQNTSIPSQTFSISTFNSKNNPNEHVKCSIPSIDILGAQAHIYGSLVNRMEHYPTCSYCWFGISRIFLPCKHKSIYLDHHNKTLKQKLISFDNDIHTCAISPTTGLSLADLLHFLPNYIKLNPMAFSLFVSTNTATIPSSFLKPTLNS